MVRPTHNRTACDRCRAHKLRCTQTEPRGSGPCARCIRAGAECVTSGAKPSGRPRKARGAAFEDGPMRDEPMDVARVSAPESLVEVEARRGGSTAWMSYDPAVFPTDPQVEHAVDLWPTGDQIQYLATDMAWLNEEVFSGPSEFRPVADPGLGPDALLPEGPTAKDIPTALAGLSETISQQLARSRAFQNELNIPPSDVRPPRRAPSANGVAVALKCTSEFTKILQSPALRTRGDPGGLDDASSELIDTPTALLILSSYIQLTHLYDTIFRFLCKQFCENPHAIGKCPSSADSQFKVAGVSAIDGRLHVKLLIQTIEHHIEGLERLLGLPVGVSVAGRDTQHQGIFGDSGLRSIAGVVMSRAEDPDGSPKERILSLRGAIQETKDLL